MTVVASPGDDARRRGRARETVVFDLDGTLVAGDSFSRFVRTLVMRHPARRVAALLSLPAWLPALGVGRTRLPAERFLVWLSALGMDDDAFAAATRSFAAEHAGSAGGRVAAAALQRLHEHLDRGDRVIVATGCAEPLARELCDVLGLQGVEVVASTVTRRRWKPPLAVQPARGEGKLRALRAAGVDLPVDHAYSDSVVDLPLLLNARTAHVVDPTRRHWPRLQDALGAEVDLLRWAGPRDGARADAGTLDPTSR